MPQRMPGLVKTGAAVAAGQCRVFYPPSARLSGITVCTALCTPQGVAVPRGGRAHRARSRRARRTAGSAVHAPSAARAVGAEFTTRRARVSGIAPRRFRDRPPGDEIHCALTVQRSEAALRAAAPVTARLVRQSTRLARPAGIRRRNSPQVTSAAVCRRRRLLDTPRQRRSGPVGRRAGRQCRAERCGPYAWSPVAGLTSRRRGQRR